jgi:hypothetical protein
LLFRSTYNSSQSSKSYFRAIKDGDDDDYIPTDDDISSGTECSDADDSVYEDEGMRFN